MKKSILLVLVAFLYMAFQGIILADEIMDKSGKIYCGKISSMTKDYVMLRTNQNTIKIKTSDIQTPNQ